MCITKINGIMYVIIATVIILHRDDGVITLPLWNTHQAWLSLIAEFFLHNKTQWTIKIILEMGSANETWRYNVTVPHWLHSYPEYTGILLYW